MIAKNLLQNINRSRGLGPSADYAALQALLADKKNYPYLFLGCQGPDFLFFNTKDWPVTGLGDAVKLYFEYTMPSRISKRRCCRWFPSRYLTPSKPLMMPPMR
jgi:hypothetical protein